MQAKDERRYMSKLDNILLECVNKALDGKEEKLGDYIDPTKQQIKELIQDLIDETFTDNDGLAYDFWKRIEKL